MSNKSFAGFALLAAVLLGTTTAAFAQDDTAPQTGYASVNELEMYYEIHGTGEPIVVLHGAYMAIPLMSEFIAGFAETRQVIAVEFQGHGRTADIPDRPFSYEQLADDVAALMDEIGVSQADIFGFSLGGGVALQMGIRHPAKVDQLVVASATFNSGGLQPGLVEMIGTMTPEMFAGTPIETDYQALAPNPENFPLLVEKMIALDLEVQDWSPESIQAITAPTYIIVGDSDSVTLEHSVELFRLLGGGVNADLVGYTSARFTVLPATSHIGVMFRASWLIPMINEFLDAQPAA